MWAARQFGDVDPEAAASAIHSIFALLSTQDVLDMRRWARQPPPSKPALRELSAEALIERFEETAEQEGASQFLDPVEERRDLEAKNRISGEMLDIVQELKRRDLLDRIAPFLDSESMSVRQRAAQVSLRRDKSRAVAALESVIARGSFQEALAARETLETWSQGRCILDDL